MSFLSPEFYGFVGAVAILYYSVPGRHRSLVLVVASLVYCALANVWTLPPLLVGSVATYSITLRLADETIENRRLQLLWVAVAINLGMVVAYKFAGAFAGIILPLGLSYYSFKLLSYVIDVYWDEIKVKRDLISLGAFSSFFPQIVSGPIQRPAAFFEQSSQVAASPANYAQIERGLELIVGGLLMKMLVGDRLRGFIDTVLNAPASYTQGVVALAILSLILQLYVDFAGYTNIALGVGKIFGFDGPANFNAPFAAANLQEYWRRWHMSLTTWLTDYVFMPLRMATRSLGSLGLMVSIFINMVLIGIWHGFTLNYLIFGVLNGTFMAVSAVTLSKRDAFFKPFPRVVKIARAGVGGGVTFLLIAVTQMFFQTRTPVDAVQLFQLAVGLLPAGSMGMETIKADVAEAAIPCMMIAYYLGFGAPGWRIVWTPVKRSIPVFVRLGIGLLLLSSLSIESGSSFIYGQF